MMRELTLQELKDIEFNLLKRFHSFCEEHNIRYYFAYGTLLGAIRYKGFIPWDDDIDVLVPREDYERLLTLFQDSERYRLFSPERNKRFYHPFAKLCDMTTRKEEFNAQNGVEVGVDIDIFPLDYWDDDLDKAKKEAARISKYMSWLNLAKRSRSTIQNPVKRLYQNTMIVWAKLMGCAHYIKKIQKATYKKEQIGSRYIGSKSWCVYGSRGIIPSEAFSEVIQIEFEGELFSAPVGYDTYLTCLYGDYLPEPPKEKQKTHHNFKAYRIV